MNRTLGKTLLVVALFCFAVGCGEEQDSGTTADAGDGVDTTAENPIEGPEDCENEEWFKASDTTCQSCPATELTCASLDLEASAIDATNDSVEFHVQADLTQLTAATIKGNEIDEVCMGAGGGGGGGGECVRNEKPFEVEGVLEGNQMTFEITQVDEYSSWMEVDELVLTDACGQEHTVMVAGSWDLDADETDSALACP